MQNRKDLHLNKRITALVMSAVLLATSVPLLATPVAAGTDGSWDPAPQFSKAAREEGATAWFTEDGAIQVKFPEADGGQKDRNKKKEEQKKVQYYILALYNLGLKAPALDKPEELPTEAILTKAFSTTELKAEMAQDKSDIKMLGAELPAGELKAKAVARDDQFRYNIRITAVDGETPAGNTVNTNLQNTWFSEPMDTVVTEVPYFEYDADRYGAIIENENALRPIIRCEENALDGGATEFKGQDGTEQPVEFPYGTPEPNVGAPDPKTYKASKAYGFRIYGDLKQPVHFDTASAREAFDFYGAEEVWFWFDCSDVCLNNVSLRLRPNEKYLVSWGDGSTNFDGNKNGQVFSTKGFAENASAEYKESLKKKGKTVKLQQKDGGWENVDLAAGEKLNLDHFKGYVRVPIEFFCAQEDSIADVKNTGLDGGHSNKDATTKHKIQPVKIDDKGVCITDAHLMQTLWVKRNFPLPTYSQEVGRMPAVAVRKGYSDQESKTRRTTWDEEKKQYITPDERVKTTEMGLEKSGTYKAIEDIYSVGFEFDNATASKDSIFFFDNAMTYKSEGKYPKDNLEGGTVSDGEPVNQYYNQKMDRANVILDAVDEFIKEPNWTDYRQVEYISKMTAGFAKAFAEEKLPRENRVFSDDGMAKAAKALGRDSTWAKYQTARDSCIQEGTIRQEKDGSLIAPSNANSTELVPILADELEKLPPADKILSATPKQAAQIKKICMAYLALNYGQLEALGADAKQQCLDYARLLDATMGAEDKAIITGTALAEQPFLPFCDFEQTSIKTDGKLPQVEDDRDAYLAVDKKANPDFRHQKGVYTFTDILSKVNDANVNLNTALSQDAGIHAATGYLENNGFKNSKAATVYIDGTTAEKAGSSSMPMHTVTVSKDGKDNGNWGELNNHGGFGAGGYKLGNLAATYSGSAEEEKNEPPLSLIFYADFSQLQNFQMTIGIFTEDENGNEVKCRPNMGLQGFSKGDKKYFLLDTTPNSPTEGQWVLTHSDGQYDFTSTSPIAEDKMDLNGYKGYVRIPLYHLKQWVSAVSETKMDEDAALLNNIYAVQIGIGGPDLQGKSFTIDNIGFTYSQKKYVDDPVASGTKSELKGRRDKTYEEIYNAKSTRTDDFIKLVESIDPYNSTQPDFADAVTKARTAYDALDAGHPEKMVQRNYAKKAETLLEKYEGYVKHPDTLPTRENPYGQKHPSITTTDDLQAIVKDDTCFPQLAKKADEKVLAAKTKTNVPFPGFTDDGNVNYAGLGFQNKTEAEQLVKFCEDYFPTLKKSVQEAFIENAEDYTAFQNAYHAARRCLELENIKTAVNEMDKNLQGLFMGADKEFTYQPEYTAQSAETPLPYAQIANREKIQTSFLAAYVNQPFYAKIALETGAVVPAMAGKNIGRGLTMFLENSKKHTADGKTIQGGLWELKAIYDDLNTKVTNALQDSTLLDTQAVTEAIQNYESLVPWYKMVGELYTPIEHIRRKFPVVKTAAADTTSVLQMTEKQKTAAEQNTYKITYAVALPELNPTQENVLAIQPSETTTGKLAGANYTLKFTFSDGTEKEVKSADLAAKKPVEVLTIAPNQYGKGKELTVDVTCTLNGKVTAFDGTDSFDLTVMTKKTESGTEIGAFEPAKNNQTVPSVIAIKHYTLQYTQGDAFTVAFPAETEVAWGTTDVPVGYTVNSNMRNDSKLTVTVADKKDTIHQLFLNGTDVNQVLNYTPTGFAPVEFKGSQTDAKPAETPQMKIDYANKGVGNYQTTLTYTVTYTKGS